jgi:hypothetical protein
MSSVKLRIKTNDPSFVTERKSKTYAVNKLGTEKGRMRVGKLSINWINSRNFSRQPPTGNTSNQGEIKQ